jgi:hypothetical protein
MAHAAFGLINSTPRSAVLPDEETRALLTAMAGRALGVAPAAGRGASLRAPDQADQ